MSGSGTAMESLRKRYLRALLASDADQAAMIVAEGLKSGLGARQLYVGVLMPGQVELGERWAKGEVSVAIEHRATEITMEQMSLLRQTLQPEESLGKSAVVATPAGELHSVGARLFADLLVLDGWLVDFLGPNLPGSALADYVHQRPVDLVVLSVILKKHLPAIREAIDAVRQRTPQTPILIGGGDFLCQKAVSDSLDVDEICCDPAEGLGVARRLVGLSAPRHRSLGDLLQGLGGRVLSVRRSRGWSQARLSASAGLDRTYISAVERGRQNLSLGAVVKLADALEVSVEELLLGPGRES